MQNKYAIKERARRNSSCSCQILDYFATNFSNCTLPKKIHTPSGPYNGQ